MILFLAVAPQLGVCPGGEPGLVGSKCFLGSVFLGYLQTPPLGFTGCQSKQIPAHVRCLSLIGPLAIGYVEVHRSVTYSVASSDSAARLSLLVEF